MSIDPSALARRPCDCEDTLEEPMFRMRAWVARSYAVADQY
jgi:hypothetical protein